MKLLKKILLITLSCIIILVIGAVSTFHLLIKPKYGDQLIAATNMFLEDNDISAILDDNEINDVLNNIDDKKPSSETDIQPSTQAQSEQQSSENQSNTIVTEGDTSSSAIVSPPPSIQPKSTGDKMDDIKKQVAPKDLADGMKIVSKIDVGYLSGLTKGGMTTEKKVEAYNYLNSKLSNTEYQRLKSLVAKYQHLLK